MSKILVRKNEVQGMSGPQVFTQPGGGASIAMPAPSWDSFNQQKYEDAGYRPEAVESARRWHTMGNIARGAAAGLGALNAIYNQTASGEPGVLNAAMSGGYQGLAGSQGLADFAGEWGARRGQRRNMVEEEKAKKERDSMADPNYTGRLSSDNPNNQTFDIHESFNPQLLDTPYIAPPTQNNTVASTNSNVSMDPVMDTLRQRYGDDPVMGSLKRWDDGQY